MVNVLPFDDQECWTTNVVLPPTITNGVELLFPQSASFGMKWPIAVGDPVLLIGLKDFIPKTASVQASADGVRPPIFSHFKQETMKAIPLNGGVSTPAVTQVVDSSNNLIVSTTGSGKERHLLGSTGTFKVANGSASLATIITNLNTYLTTFATGLNAGTLTSQASALVASLTTLVVSINALLEA